VRKPVTVAIKRDATYPPLLLQLVSHGQAADLTTAVGVELRMHTDTAPRTRKFTGAFAIVDPPTLGQVLYAWRPSDTDTAGDYLAEVRILYGDGTTERLPEPSFIRVHIDADLDNA